MQSWVYFPGKERFVVLCLDMDAYAVTFSRSKGSLNYGSTWCSV